MITDPADYIDKLIEIQDANHKTQVILLPTDETLFPVDLNARTVSVPQFLSVQSEHNAETIYFKVARYFENIDLSQMTCVVQYINANQEGGIFAVPFVDVTTFKETNEMLIPWAIGGKATAYSGVITFSIRFYQLNKVDKTFDYNLATQPKESEILYGFEPIDGASADYNVDSSLIEQVYERLNQVQQQSILYWTEA